MYLEHRVILYYKVKYFQPGRELLTEGVRGDKSQNARGLKYF